MSLDGVSFLEDSGMGAGFGGGVTYPGVEPGGELVVSGAGERSIRWRNKDGLIVSRVVSLDLNNNNLKGEWRKRLNQRKI